MNKSTRGRALLGSLPTAVVLALALAAPSMGPVSPSLALVSDHEALAEEAEATADAAEVEVEAPVEEAEVSPTPTQPEGEGATSDASAAADEEVINNESTDNARTFDDEQIDAAGNVVESDASADDVGADAVTRIMPLGDSITYGTEALGISGYRGPLEDKLVGAHVGFDFVGPRSDAGEGVDDNDHAGFRGNTISDIKTRVAAGLITTYDPDTVLLLIGTNDIDGDDKPSDVSIDDYIDGAPDRLRDLVRAIVRGAPSAKVLVGSIPPRTDDRNDETDDYNDAIPGAVSGISSNVKFVDTSGLLNASTNSQTGDLDNDGKHPSRRGYTKIATAWFDAINASSSGGSTTTTTKPPTASSTTTSSTTTTVLAGRCADGKLPNAKSGKCSDGTEPTSANVATDEAVTCPDGKLPNGKNGTCSGGFFPSQAISSSEPIRCADGKAPNAKAGKCT